MSGDPMDLSRLKEPFLPWQIEWRVMQAGKKNGRVWAKVIAYVESRAIMERLDEVCGLGGWQTRFRTADGHVTCDIGLRIDGEWVWKGDGAGYLEVTGGLSSQDAGKGDYSNALKRAAVQWSIGRYLYDLDEAWANVHDNGANYGRLPKNKGGDSFHWDPPELPSWALPEEAKKGMEPPVDKETGEITEGSGTEVTEAGTVRVKGEPASEDTLVAISDALETLKGMDKDKYGNAYKHYENNLDAIAGSQEEADKFLNRCKLTIEVLEEEKEAVTA